MFHILLVDEYLNLCKNSFSILDDFFQLIKNTFVTHKTTPQYKLHKFTRLLSAKIITTESEKEEGELDFDAERGGW